MIKIINNVEAGKTAVICIAGNLCSPFVFDQINVPKTHQKLYLDYLNAPGLWDMDHMGWELIQLVEVLGLDSVILAGYSAGGVLAMSAAAKKPELFAGLLLSNTGPCSENHGNPEFVKELRANFKNEEYIRDFLNSCFYKKTSQKTEDMLWEYARQVQLEAACEVSESLRSVDYREALRQFKNPVVIAHGKYDTRRNMHSVEMMMDCMPQAELFLLETGHTPMVEDCDGYEKALERCVELVEQNRCRYI